MKRSFVFFLKEHLILFFFMIEKKTILLSNENDWHEKSISCLIRYKYFVGTLYIKDNIFIEFVMSFFGTHELVYDYKQSYMLINTGYNVYLIDWSWIFWRSSSEKAVPLWLIGVVGAERFFCKEWSSSSVVAFTVGPLSSWHMSLSLLAPVVIFGIAGPFGKLNPPSPFAFPLPADIFSCLCCLL